MSPSDLIESAPSWTRALRRAGRVLRTNPVPQFSTFWRYATAPITTLACCFIQLAISPRPEIAPFVFFFVAVVITAWLGGRGPGLLAVVLSATTANVVFLSPHWGGALRSPALASTVLFCGAASLIAIVCGLLRDTMFSLRASEERLRLAQEAARMGTFEWNAQTGLSTWSPMLEAMHGLPAGSFARTLQA